MMKRKTRAMRNAAAKYQQSQGQQGAMDPGSQQGATELGSHLEV